jgi:DNA-directed RNA polymerase subunit RPC12/RpoP
MVVAGTCPHCGGKILDREPQHGFFDKVMRVVHLRPFRCRRCYHRFYGLPLAVPFTRAFLPYLLCLLPSPLFRLIFASGKFW